MVTEIFCSGITGLFLVKWNILTLGAEEVQSGLTDIEAFCVLNFDLGLDLDSLLPERLSQAKQRVSKLSIT